jgi:hypothetical protein
MFVVDRMADQFETIASISAVGSSIPRSIDPA